jgi:hypothetical protein
MIDEPLTPNCIALVHSVLATVNFNYESSFTANEIDNVWSNGFLPYKFDALERSRTKVLPTSSFRRGRILPQPSR